MSRLPRTHDIVHTSVSLYQGLMKRVLSVCCMHNPQLSALVMFDLPSADNRWCTCVRWLFYYCCNTIHTVHGVLQKVLFFSLGDLDIFLDTFQETYLEEIVKIFFLCVMHFIYWMRLILGPYLSIIVADHDMHVVDFRWNISNDIAISRLLIDPV